MLTTEALRKVISVQGWELNEYGMNIHYTREDATPKEAIWTMCPSEALHELSMVGSIEDTNDKMTHGLIDGIWYSFEEIVLSYKVGQWEALSIAIRHEECKELAKCLEVFEIETMFQAVSNK